MKETKEELLVRVGEIIQALKDTYPEAPCALIHSSAFELLIATALAAQCTDERVNIVTADLFRKYRKPEDYVTVSREELERDINAITFFRNKAKSIQEACRLLIDKHGGQVPQNLKALVELPGVGRKTANVVLGTAFGIPSGVVVDTHVSRLSQRLGLTENKQPEPIETDLMGLLPQNEWIDFSHRLVWHGRKVCTARKPMCDKCSLEKFCPSSTTKK